MRVLEEGGRGQGRGRGVVSKGRGKEIVREKRKRRENWRGKGKERRGRGRGREKGRKKETRLRFSNNCMVQCVTVSNSTIHFSLLLSSQHLQTVWLQAEQSGLKGIHPVMSISSWAGQSHEAGGIGRHWLVRLLVATVLH